MPQAQFDPADGWIRADQFALPRQHLDVSEIDAFLESLFGDVAQRPKGLRLLESAAVVRYLRLLALRGVPSEVVKQGEDAILKYRESKSDEHRERAWYAEKAAEIIWAELGSHGKITPSGKGKALQFLREHSEAYLWFYAKPVLDFVQSFDLPPNCEDEDHSLEPPSMTSRSMTYGGERNPHLQNDLTERICGACYALRRERVKKVRLRVAEALQRANVQKSQKRTSHEAIKWSDQDVNDRIKQREREQRKEMQECLQAPSDEQLGAVLQGWRDQLADRWISSWRWKLTVERGRHLQQSPP